MNSAYNNKAEEALKAYFCQAVQDASQAAPPHMLLDTISMHKEVKDQGKKSTAVLEGALQALLAVAASLLIVYWTGNTSSGALAQQLRDEGEFQRVHEMFSELSQELDHGLTFIIENNRSQRRIEMRP
ncbi:hypothetical protein [Gracilinema caldarium]|uniref:hypothetical protein n=1 Tax=Gracilinema caldarium TaxID=215591 RepID=UPI0026EA0681|nr:hypothetical protein [Gracilinema caldarium]